MAALVETPLKPVDCKQCFLCKTSSRRLHCLTHNKAVNEYFVHYIELTLDVILNVNFLHLMLICDRCIKACKTHVVFKSECRQSIETFYESLKRTKRQAKTPPSSLKQGLFRETVASQIEKSVEKLKRLQLGDKKRFRTKLFSSPEKDARNEECAGRPSDHHYSKPRIREENDVCVNYIDAPDILRQAKQLNPLPNLCSQLQKICKPGNTILFGKETSDLESKNWFAEVIREMNSNCPELLAVLSCSIGDASSTESKIATIATIYGMIMHSRNVRAAAIQRIFTTLALRYHADNKLLERLNKVHLTLSHETKRNILHDFSMYCDEKIIQQVSAGKDGKINGDNLDIFVRTNDMRMKNKNKDYHFFASDWTVDRVDVNECDDKNPVGDIALVTPECFILSNDELHLYKESLKILLGRIISQYVPEFEWMKSVIPTHIPHQLDEVMSTKSGIYWLPILLKNEASYSDCIQIMASYEQQICKWYTTAGRGKNIVI